jgi:thiol-disulfide isomerase/thioredoxin
MKNKPKYSLFVFKTQRIIGVGKRVNKRRIPLLLFNLKCQFRLLNLYCKRYKNTVMKRITCSLAALCMAFLLMISQIVIAGDAFAEQSTAPSFSGVTVDGRPFSSASLKGKAYIVNFFASWCPPCRAEIPDMVKVQRAWESKGFTFVGIAVNEQVPNVKNFKRQNGITYPVMMATPGLVRAFNGYIAGGISGIPTSFVVDASGRLTGVIVGPRSKAEFEQMVKTALNAKPVK